MRSWQLAHFSQQVKASDYSSLPRPKGVQWSVRVVVPMNGGIVAVEHTKDEQSYWILPGGGIKRGELIAAAGKREVHEETQLTVEIERLLYVRESHIHRSVEWYVLGKYISGEMKMNPPDGDDPFLTDIAIISFEELEQRQDLTFYPESIRKRLRRDIILSPTTALYLGEVP